MYRRALNTLWLPSILAAVFLLAGCGVGEGLPVDYDNVEYNLSDNFKQAVWHDGTDLIDSNPQTEDDAGVFVAPVLMLEDGEVYNNVLVSKPPFKDDAKAVFGIYQVDIPDADRISFIAKVGFPYFDDPAQGQILFKLYIQDGDDFPVLAEFKTPYEGKLKVFEADLTDYRGRNVFVMVSVESLGDNNKNLQGAWFEPKLSFDYY